MRRDMGSGGGGQSWNVRRETCLSSSGSGSRGLEGGEEEGEEVGGYEGRVGGEKKWD